MSDPWTAIGWIIASVLGVLAAPILTVAAICLVWALVCVIVLLVATPFALLQGAWEWVRDGRWGARLPSVRLFTFHVGKPKEEKPR